jgi:hypothetical protein
MADLTVGRRTYPLQNSKYAGFLQITGTNKFIKANSVSITRQGEHFSSTFSDLKYLLDDDKPLLYRGICGSHSSWDMLMNHGILVSEGNLDLPGYSMMGSGTRWLPSDIDVILPSTCAESIWDQFHDYRDSTHTFPLGVIVQINVNQSIPICYLNRGETSVQGPLTLLRKEYEYYGISLWEKGQIKRILYQRGTLLPPQRPYNKSRHENEMWLEEVKSWVESNKGWLESGRPLF